MTCLATTSRSFPWSRRKSAAWALRFAMTGCSRKPFALALAGAEVLIRVSAYMDPWGATPPLDWWTLFNRARAVENFAYVVAANQGASASNYPPFSWPGGSMIVDYDGRILAQADPGPGEKIVVGPIDIAALRAERLRRRGHDLLSHLRADAYTELYARPIYRPGSRST